MSQKHRPQVVLVGRPNVGKSTLFNRLTGARRSIVTAVAGTTRDVITQTISWDHHAVDLTDTGGLFGASQDPLHELVFARGRRALASADLIVFVVDGREGLVPGDEEIAAAIRQTGVPAVMAVNKVDDRRSRDGALELYKLGFDAVCEISAEHGVGVGDLLDAITERLPPTGHHAEAASDEGDAAIESEESRRRADRTPQETAIAIVGRPNAGKSSLVNRLLREERMIVSEVPGTTRDSVDSMLAWHKRQFRIVDTAGIRRPGRVSKSGQVETLSVLLARRAIERADVVVLVIDATLGPTDQDGAIAGAAHDAGRAIIIAANKWDLMKEQGDEAARRFDQHVRDTLKFLDYAPIVHLSAVTGERTPKLLEMVAKVSQAARTRVPTGELNRFFEKITTASPPVTAAKRNMRVLYASQAGVAPPTFVLFTNSAGKLHFSYERFLQNRLREAYGFAGTPIRIIVRGKTARRPDARPAERPAPRRRESGPADGRAALGAEGRVLYCPVEIASMAAPKRELFKAADVCDVVQVQPYVLRSWEAEFPQIGEVRTDGGPRLYRRSDVELVLKIKQLVFEEGLTLAGARRRLEEESENEASPGGAAALMGNLLDEAARDRVRRVRGGLQALLQLLSGESAAVAELRLVAPPEPKRRKKSKA